MINVNDNDSEDWYFDTYEGKLGVVRAKLSTRSFNNQNAITEVDTIDATSHLDGRPITDNAPIITPTHIARAHLDFDCDCDENEDDDEAASNTPSTPSASVPGPPAYVSAQGYNGSVSVSFASPSNKGGADITRYKYRYSVTYGTYGDWIAWDNLNNPNIPVYDLTNGVQYQFI